VVYLVGGGPGDPALITVRGAELVASADVILHDELVHPSVYEAARGEVRSVGKRGGDRVAKTEKQAEIEAELVQLAREGKSVVRLKGGDPFLFGRGSEEAETLAREGIAFEVVPGIPSPFGATAYAGISVTHRDLASSVVIVSGTTRAGVDYDFGELASVDGTICVLMGMKRLDHVTERIMRDAKRSPDSLAVVIERGTLPSQRVVEGKLGEIAACAREKGLGSPAILLVGAVAELRRSIRWFDNRPLFGRGVVLTRPRAQAGATARLLRTRGAEPLVFPTIELCSSPEPERVARAVAELHTYDLCAFTSENGVDKLFEAIADSGRDARAFGASLIATIGSGTARALAEHGLRADILPNERAFIGEGLARAILDDPRFASKLAGSGRAPRVILPRAKIAREILPESLRAAGCEVDVVPVYETRVAPERDRKELAAVLAEGRANVVLLTASSTVDGLVEMLGADARALLEKATLASIGPVTTKTAERHGLRVAVTATVSTVEGLIADLESYFEAKRS
jgi:uroporphyrinogen III methyltransferase/synthase